MLLRHLLFQFSVSFPFFFVGTHKVPECQMAVQAVPVVSAEQMNLMGPFFSAFAEIAPAGDSKLPHTRIAGLYKGFRNRVHFFQTSHSPKNIDHRLGRQPRHRRTADMPQRQAVLL